jgi:hypothetical protein
MKSLLVIFLCMIFAGACTQQAFAQTSGVIYLRKCVPGEVLHFWSTSDAGNGVRILRLVCGGCAIWVPQGGQAEITHGGGVVKRLQEGVYTLSSNTTLPLSVQGIIPAPEPPQPVKQRELPHRIEGFIRPDRPGVSLN